MVSSDQPQQPRQPQAFSITADSAVALGGQVFGRIMLYIFNWLLARHLGASGFGAYALIMYIARLGSTLANFGLNATAVRYISFYRGSRDLDRLQLFLQIAPWVITVLGLSVATIFWVGNELIADLVGMPTDGILFSAILSLLVPIMALYRLWIACIHGLGKVTWRIIVEMVAEPMTVTILLILLSLSEISLLGVLFATLLSYFILTVFIGILLAKLLRSMSIQNVFWSISLRSIRAAKQWMNFSGAILLRACIMLMVAAMQGFFLKHFVGIDAVGIYEITLKLAMLVVIPMTAIAIPFWSTSAEMYGRNDKLHLTMLLQISTRWSFILAFTVFLVVLTLRAPLLLLFGAEFISGETALLILLVGSLINAFTGPTESMLHTIGRADLDLLNAVASLVVNLILNFCLVPTHGIIGASIAFSAVIITNNLLRLVELFYLVGIWPYTRISFYPLLLGLITLGGIEMVRPQLMELPLVISLSLTCFTIVPLYLIGSALWGMSESERLILQRLATYCGVLWLFRMSLGRRAQK